MRKIQEMGGGTALISLPKQWVKRNNISKGSALGIEEGSDNSLVLRPLVKGEKKIRESTIYYPAEYLEYTINEITGAYLLGYDVVRIQARERIRFEDREMVKKAVRQLIGFEIVEEDATSITAQFQGTVLDPEKIFRRMHVIVNGMHRDASTSLLERDRHLVKVAADRDDEVDRLYFLLVRLIRSAVIDSSLTAKFRLTPIDCLDYRVAANVLETIGDFAVDMARSVMQLIDPKLSDEIRDKMHDLSEMLDEMQERAVKAFLTKDPKDARAVLKLYSEASSKLSELEEIRSSTSPDVAKHMLSLQAAISGICKGNVDIADLTYTVYPTVR